MSSAPYVGARPYRVEILSFTDRFGAATFASEEAALIWARKQPPGTKYRVTKRLNKSGSKKQLLVQGRS